MALSLRPYIAEFARDISSDTVEVYNEFSVQFELAMFLRSHLASRFSVQLERNIGYFNLEKATFIKREMDIVVFSQSPIERHCIEIKFPLQGQYPEQMFSACKDVRFLEQLVESGFNSGCFLMLANEAGFYGDRGPTGIYQMFRAEKLTQGMVQKPTGSRDEVLHLSGNYRIEWQPLFASLRYFVIEVVAHT